MLKKEIHTHQAPDVIGAYSQAIQVGNVVYLSGQIPLHPQTMTLVKGDMAIQTTQIFTNLKAVCEASGSNLDAIVKLTIYLIDLSDFVIVNEVMAKFFQQPYPARATIQVSALPKSSRIEIDGILVI